MSTVQVVVNITGTADIEDKQAFILAIDRENERRAFTGEPVLPKGTAAERKASMETILTRSEASSFATLVSEAADRANQDASFRAAKTKWNELTPSQRTAWLAFTP